jgi:hypothetical protein
MFDDFGMANAVMNAMIVATASMSMSTDATLLIFPLLVPDPKHDGTASSPRPV